MSFSLRVKIGSILVAILFIFSFTHQSLGQEAGAEAGQSILTRTDRVIERRNINKEESAREATERQTRAYRNSSRRGGLIPDILSVRAIDGSKTFDVNVIDTIAGDYEEYLNKFANDTSFASNHFKLNFEDFAKSYFIVAANSVVKNTFNSGLDLAIEKSKFILGQPRKTFEEIITARTNLNASQVKLLEWEAGKTLKSFKGN